MAELGCSQAGVPRLMAGPPVKRGSAAEIPGRVPQCNQLQGEPGAPTPLGWLTPTRVTSLTPLLPDNPSQPSVHSYIDQDPRAPSVPLNVT